MFEDRDKDSDLILLDECAQRVSVCLDHGGDVVLNRSGFWYVVEHLTLVTVNL